MATIYMNEGAGQDFVAWSHQAVVLTDSELSSPQVLESWH